MNVFNPGRGSQKLRHSRDPGFFYAMLQLFDYEIHIHETNRERESILKPVFSGHDDVSELMSAGITGSLRILYH